MLDFERPRAPFGVVPRSDPLARVSALAGRAFAEPEEALAAILRLVRDVLGVDTALLASADGHAWRATHVDDAALGIAPGDTLALDAPGRGLVVASGGPVQFNDAPADPLGRRVPAVARFGIRTYLGVPVTSSDGAVVGALCALDRAAGDLGPDDIAVLQVLARLAAHELGRVVAARALGESEARRRALLGAMPDLLFLLDRRGTYLEFSAEDDRDLAKAPSEFLGRTVVEVLPERVAIRIMVAIAAVLDGRGPVVVEYPLAVDGGIKIFEARIGAAGPDEVLAVVRDVTERHRMEEQNREREARYRDLVDHGQGLICAFDLDGILLSVNPAAARALGYEPAELVGTDLAGYLSPRSARHWPRVLRRLRRQSSLGGVFWLQTRDGEERCWAYRLVRREEDGRPAYALGHAQDVTAQQRAEAALRESQRRASALAATAQRQARELTLLHEVRTALARHAALPALLREMVDATARILGYDQVSLYTIEGEEFVLQHQVGYQNPITRIPVRRGVIGRVVRTGRAILVADRRTDPDFLVAQEDIAAQVSVPLWDEGRVVGVLTVETVGDRRLDEDDRRLMTVLADHLGPALERARLLAEVRTSEARFSAFMDRSPAIAWMKDEAFRFAYVSRPLAERFELAAETMLGEDDFAFFAPEVAAVLRANDETVLVEDRAVEAIETVPTPDGSARHWLSVKFPFRDPEGRRFVGGMALDVTARLEAEVALQDSEARFRSIFDTVAEGIVLRQADGTVYAANASAERLLGLTADQLMGRSSLDPSWGVIRENGDPWPIETQPGMVALTTGQPVDGAVMGIRSTDGAVTWILTTAQPLIRPGEERPHAAVSSFTDITARKVEQDRLRRQAFHDPLTDLPNRILFAQRLDAAIVDARQRQASVALLFLDLDGFKTVNDTMGHEAGNRLLVAVAGRLRSCVRTTDTVARAGGDEFTILLPDPADAGEAERVAVRIVAALEPPFAVDGREVRIGASVGVAIAAPGVDGAEDLLRHADEAMYRAKGAGKGRFAR